MKAEPSFLAPALPALIAALAVMGNATPTRAALQTWTGGGGDDHWSTSANWSGGAPVTADPLVFRGTVRQQNSNDVSGLNVAWVLFENGGFDLSGNALTVSGYVTNLAGVNRFGMDLDLGTAVKQLWVMPGAELILGGNTTIAAGNRDQQLYGGGTLRITGPTHDWQGNAGGDVYAGTWIADGAAITHGNDGLRIRAVAGDTAQVILTNHASYLLQGGANLRLGQGAGTNLMTVESGSFTVSGGNNTGFYIGETAGGTAILTQNGGELHALTPGDNAGVRFGQNSGAEGIYNFNGGLLATRRIYKQNAGAIAIFNLNGGTIKPLDTRVNFMEGLDSVTIQSGGVTFDTDGFDITVAQSLGGPGSLIKNGTNALVLRGDNSFGGTVTLNAGTLGVRTSHCGTGALILKEDTTLNVEVASVGSSLVTEELFFGEGFYTPVLLNFELNGFGNPVAPIITATNLNMDTDVVVGFSGLGLSVGRFTLIQYGALVGAGFGGFVLNTWPAGVDASLEDTGTSIDIVIRSVPEIVWTGATDGDWDIAGKLNWFDPNTSSATTFSDGQYVRFDDTATGPTDVNLTTTVSPTFVFLTNGNVNYRFAGGGAINAIGLRKEGPNPLTIANGGSNAIGTLVLNEGSVVLDQPLDTTLNSALLTTEGAGGALVKQGANTLTLAGNSSAFSGPVQVAAGTLRAAHGNALGSDAGATTVADGATFDLNAQNLGREPFIVSGTGVGGQGAVVNLGGNQQNAISDMTLAGDTTVGGTGRWDVRTHDDTELGLRAHGFKLTKVGPGEMRVNGSAANPGVTNLWETDLGDIEVLEGLFAIERKTTIGRPTNSVIVHSNATLVFYATASTNVQDKIVFLTNASFHARGPDDVIFRGPMTMTGSNDFNLDANFTTLSGLIQGDGLFSKSGGGPLLLPRANPFAGGSSLAAGIVQLGEAGALGFGPIGLRGATLSSDGPTARLVTNDVTFGDAGGSGSGLGNTVNNGLITLAGNVSMDGANRTMNIHSAVDITGPAGNGAIDRKNGPGTLTLKSAADWSPTVGQLQIQDGAFVVDGVPFVVSDAVRVMSQVPAGVARLAILNSGSLTITAVTANLRIGYSGGDNTATNVADIAGLVNLALGGAGGRLQLGTACARAIVNLLPGGELNVRSVEHLANVSEFNFDGGLLRALTNELAATFLEGLSEVYVRDGGAIIDTAGFDLTIAQALLDGGTGGLTKQGLGTLLLNGLNTYPGATLVTDGGLGGHGTLAGPVVVQSGATLSPGISIGALILNGTLTLEPGSTTLMEIDAGTGTNDAVLGLAQVNYGGTLSVVNLAGPLTDGQSFRLFDAAQYQGAFSQLALPPLDPGLSWNTSRLAVDGTIAVQFQSHPEFGPAMRAGSDLILSGTGGTPGGTYYVLGSTDVGLPVSQWLPLATNVFDTGGNFSFTNTISANPSQQFYLLQVP